MRTRTSIMFIVFVLLVSTVMASSANAGNDGPDSFKTTLFYYPMGKPVPFLERGPNGTNTNFTLDHFEIADSRVIMRDTSGDYRAGYLPFIAAVKGSTYEVRMEYSKYSVIVLGLQTETDGSITVTDDGSSDNLVFLEVGVQVYGQAIVTDKGMKASLSDFFGLAASAKKNDASGTLSVRCVGINGTAATVLVPTGNLSLDKTSVTIVLDAVSGIKDTLLNKGTSIVPCILGFQTTSKGEDVYMAMPKIIAYLREKYSYDDQKGIVKKM